MSKVLSLAVRVTGDASRLNLTPVERALKGLEAETEKVTSIFGKFSAESEAAGRAQQVFAGRLQTLGASLKDVGAEQFAANFAQIKAEAEAAAAIFERGSQTAAKFATEQERTAQSLGKLSEELRLGAIEAPVFQRALESLTNVDFSKSEEARRLLAEFSEQAKAGTLDIDAAALSLKSLADEQTRIDTLFEDGARTAAQFATEQEKSVVALTKLVDQFKVGAIESQTFDQAISAAFNIDISDTASDVAKSVREIAEAVKAGGGNVDDYADSLRSLAEQQRAAAAAEEERARLQARADKLVQSLVTGEQERAAAAQELQQLRAAGLISEENYAGLLQRIGPITDAARQAEAALVADRQRSLQIIESLVTPQEKYEKSVAELDRLLKQNLLTTEQYNGALAKAQQTLDNAAGSAQQAGLKFNELSGIFSILPGPLGNIAGRISGVTSAAQGLNRVFSGGLSQGLSTIATQFANLATPTNVAAAAVVAFGAAAASVVNGLVQLEDRVERLGNLAEQLGVSFGFVQVLEEAGRRTGVSVQQLEGAFARFQVALSAGDEASKKTIESLGRLGIAVEDLQALPQQEQLELIASRIAAIENPAERSAAAIALFGRSGVQLIPFFRQLGAAATDLERFGAAIKDDDQRRVVALGDSLDALAVAFQGLGQDLLLPFVGTLQGVVDAISSTLSVVNSLASSLGRVLAPVLDQVGVIISALGAGIEFFGRIATAVFEALATVIEPIGKFLLPAIVAQMAFLNREILIGAVTSLARSFTAAASAIAAYATRTGVATVSTRALALSIKSLLSSTGIGALVVAAGFVVEKLIAWADASSDVADAAGEAADAVEDAADRSRKAYQTQAQAAKALAEQERKRAQEESRNVQSIIDKYLELQAIDQRFDGDRQRFEAAQRFVQIENEIVRVRQQQIEALKEGATAEAEQAGRRLRTLEEVRRREQDIASGRTKQLEEAKRRTEELAQAEAKKAQDELDNIQKVIDKFLEQQQIERRFAGDNRRFEAAQRVVEVEAEIARVQTAINIANQNSDSQAIAAAQARQKILFEILRQEQDIVSGKAQQVQEAERLAEQDRKRVQELLKPFDATAKIREDLQSVSREIVAAQERLLAGTRQEQRAAREELRDLQSLQGELTQRIRETAAGFSEGFEAAFQRTRENFKGIVAQARSFGEAGEQAAKRLEAGIAKAQEQAKSGVFNREQFEEEVRRQEELFQRELANVRAVAQEREAVNRLVDERFALARFGGDQQRLTAARNLEQIEREISRVQQEIRKARADGDNEAAAAGAARLAQLDQVAAQERDIASGRRQLEQQIAQQRQEAQQQIQQQQQQAAEQQKKVREEQAKAAEAEFNRQRTRIRELNNLGAGVIQGVDLRSGEGAALFQQLTANAQDPALIEARLQTRRLGELVNLVAGLTNLPIRTIGLLGVG